MHDPGCGLWAEESLVVSLADRGDPRDPAIGRSGQRVEKATAQPNQE
jgi:hypothetical protein